MGRYSDTLIDDPVLGHYFFHEGQLVRAYRPEELERNNENRIRDALHTAEKLIYDPPSKIAHIGDVALCTHVHATHGLHKEARVRIVNYSHRGSFVDVLVLEDREFLNGISTTCIVSCIEKYNRDLNEALTDSNPFERKIAKNRLEFDRWIEQVKRMNKDERVKTFSTYWQDPVYETAKSAPIEGQFYRLGFADGYEAAKRELLGQFREQSDFETQES